MVWYQALALLAVLNQWAEAQCAPTTTVVVEAGTFPTISANTYAIFEDSASALVLECGTASVGNSGMATLSEGTATLSGFTYQVSATASIKSRGRIPYAQWAEVTVAPQATATVDSGGHMDMTIGDGASVSMAGRPGEGFFASGGDITVSASDEVYVYATGSGARLYLTGSNVAGGVMTTGGTAVAVVTGGGVDVADGGLATMMGQNGLLSMGESGTATVAGTSHYVYCYASGSADILGGASNSGDYGEACSGTISGSGNHVTLASLASVTVTAGASASVASGGGVYVESDCFFVNIDDGATATMVPGAVVTAGPQGVVKGSGPFVQVRSVSETEDSTIYIAVQTGTMARRNVPAPTPKCQLGTTTCPDLRGGFKCVDIQTDIFNCGGCNFGKSSVRVGIDCTEGSDGDVACVAGQCIAL